MAAEIKTKPPERNPILMSRIEDQTLDITTMSAFTPGEEGLITVSEDRSIRIWLKRETGQYWPSVCHFLASPCSTFTYNPSKQIIFVGQDSGDIEEFVIASDYNRITHQRKYAAHTSKVTGCYYDAEKEVLLSCGRDKYIIWHGTKTGQRFGGYQTSSIPSCLQYDHQSDYVFIGLTNGEIPIIKINKNDTQLVTSLKGHSASITCLCWDPQNQILYSGSNDKSVIMWDIGSRKGRAIELQGHRNKLVSIHYSARTRQLLSLGSDGSLVVWNLEIKRNETPVWQESNQCVKCKSPFFWNFRQMWNEKTIGLRQHHCRKCGIAVCANCSPDRTTIPLYGFEFEVRVCKQCFASITELDRAPTASFHELKHSLVSSSIEVTRNWLVTCGSDRSLKLWDLKEIVTN